MIIHTPELTLQEGQVRVSAKVEMLNFVADYPDTLWFQYPEDYQSNVTDRSDGFLASLFLVSMYFGEDLEVRGQVSPKLAYGIEEQRGIFNLWFPKRFRRIDIKYMDLHAPKFEQGAMEVATAFTGGVDSFYTLWSHLPDNQPNVASQIDRGLFIHGLDVDYRDTSSYLAASKRFSALFENHGLNLITAQTNVRDFSRLRIDWNYGHGGALIGTAMVLGNLIRRFYVPSTFSYKELIPLGTSPLIDHLLSTESFETVHHGALHKRFEKLERIASWTEVQKNLRVCTNQTKLYGIKNCCRCDKCLRTMAMLKAMGQLPRFSTFDLPLGHWNILRWGPKARSVHKHGWQILKYAIASRRYSLVLPVIAAIILGRTRYYLFDRVWAKIPAGIKYRLKSKLIGRG